MKYICFKKNVIFLLIFFCALNLLSASGEPVGVPDATADVMEDYDWIASYTALDPSDDYFYGKRMKYYKPSMEYVKHLKYRNDITFYIEDFDRRNPTQNSNNLPWFPHIFMPLGSLQLKLGGSIGLLLSLIDIGFVYRADNLFNSRLIFSTGFMINQQGNLNYLLNFEYPAFLDDDRLRLFNTFSFYTSGPQYVTSYYYYNYGNIWFNIFNRVWKRLETDFTRRNTTGFSNITGVDFRIPIIETNFINALELNFNYVDDQIVRYVDTDDNGDFDYPPVIEHVSDTSFNVNFIQEFKVDLMKQTSTIPEGLAISLFTKYHLPFQVGHKAKEFRFEARAEAKVYKKLFREYGFKLRVIAIANYNISRDFSKAYFRGLSNQELTGFVGLIGNFELLIPLVNVKINKAGGASLSREGNFIVYLIPFMDAGFSIDNNLIRLEEPSPRDDSKKYVTKERYYGLYLNTNRYHLTPALTSGISIKAQPYFLHFVISLDIAFDILRPVMGEGGFNLTDITISFTFNDLF